MLDRPIEVAFETMTLALHYLFKMLSYPVKAINRLIPFATPGTPLTQDLIHLLAVCTLLYFAPQIQQHFKAQEQDQAQGDDFHDTQASDTVLQDAPTAPLPFPGEEPELPPSPTAIPDLDPQDPFPAARDPDHANAAANLDAAAARPGPSRAVGAKKAASLARRDQRRAYNEFVRSQAEAARARDAEGAAEREAAAAAERVRREAVQTELREKERVERERKREAEEAAREEDIRVREWTVRSARRDVLGEGCDLTALAEVVGRPVTWVEGLVKASGVVGLVEGQMTFVTAKKWVVRARREDMDECFARLAEAGRDRVVYEDVAKVLEKVIADRGVLA